MKNWKSTLLGVIYAAAIMIVQQYQDGFGSIDWWTIGQALLGVALGAVASDSVKAESVLTNLWVNWRTTLFGLITGTVGLVGAEIKLGGTITAWDIVKSAVVVLIGLIANDGKVTGPPVKKV